jgi:hypothetical protein
VAPLTGAFVIGFIIWTYVSADKAFWLNRIEVLAILAVIAAVWLVWDHQAFALAATAVTIASCIISIFADLYPNVMVSATNPAYLTVHNTASGAELAQGDDRGRDHPAAGGARLPDWTYYVFGRRVSRQAFQPPAPAPTAAPEPEPTPRPTSPPPGPGS